MPVLHPPLCLRGDCRVRTSLCSGDFFVFLKLLGPGDLFPDFWAVNTGVPGSGEGPSSFLFTSSGLLIPGAKLIQSVVRVF